MSLVLSGVSSGWLLNGECTENHMSKARCSETGRNFATDTEARAVRAASARYKTRVMVGEFLTCKR